MQPQRQMHENRQSLMFKGAHAGITLTPTQWAALKGSAGSVAGAARGELAGLCVDLGEKRQLRLREVGKKLCADVREYYDKGGELAPGKKGAALLGLSAVHAWSRRHAADRFSSRMCCSAKL